MFLVRKSMIAGLTLAAFSLPMAATAASTSTYTYDVFGQLVSVSSTAGRTATYTYDAAANRTNMSATGAIALNAPTAETQTASMGEDAPGGAPTSQAYANNQNDAMHQNAHSQVGTTGNSITRTLR